MPSFPHFSSLHIRSDSSKPSSTPTSFEHPTKRSSGSGSHCTPGSDSRACTYPTNNNETLPIVLGVLIPIGCTVIAILYLTRRNRKRQKIEDANDKLASLDFGLGEVPRHLQNKKGKKGKKGITEPQMMDLNAERQFRQERGMSMDLGSSPYVLPSELGESRPSFHSLSRNAHDQYDPYKPVALLSRTNSPNGFLSRTPSRKDSVSMFTQSSDGLGHGNLLRNAQEPSRQSPASESRVKLSPETLPVISASPPELSLPQESITEHHMEHSDDQHAEFPVESNWSIAQSPPRLSLPREPSPSHEQPFVEEEEEEEEEVEEAPASADDLPATQYPQTQIPSSYFPTIEVTPSPQEEDFSPPPPPPPPADEKPAARHLGGDPIAPQPEKRAYSMEPYDDYVTYADVLGIVQKEPSGPTEFDEPMQGLGVQGVDYDNRRLSTGIRPLPPDDPSDNPEVRANRIRSFYREYFDESKRDTNLGLGAYSGVEYYEDYGQEYMDSATVYDPETGQWIVGPNAFYAEPWTRRARTPPPRAPPRFGGSMGSNRYFGSGQFGPGGHRPRGYSSSGPGSRARGPRKPPPPPKPLSNLPTPHLLKDDAAIFGAIDFAPPSSAKDRAAGRPDSPFVEQRPYSPSVRAFTPLASPFDELASMPSPHHLRKSGTFTALDFAPPPRLKMGDNASDAGSIRSGRSNMSASQLANIRAGTYRVSRIPKEYVGTFNDMSENLKPTWQLRGPTPGLPS